MAIQFFLTDAGRAAGLDATNLDVKVSLSHIAVGSAKYNAEAVANTKIALTTELARYPLSGGGVAGQTLRFIANIESTITADIFEIGLFTDSGVLFAIASTTTNDPLARLVTNLVSIISMGFALADVNFDNIQVVIDPNTPVSIALMNQHLAHVDPHPQYILKSSINDTLTSEATDQVLTAKQGKVLKDLIDGVSGGSAEGLSGKADKTTAINSGAGLTGGGNLSANRTLAVNFRDNLTSDDLDYALTAKQGKVLKDLIDALTAGVSGGYLPLTGGTITGSLAVEGETNLRTLAIKSGVNASNARIVIDTITNEVCFLSNPSAGDGAFSFDSRIKAKDEYWLDGNGHVTSIMHGTSLGGEPLTVFDTDNDRFTFKKPVYFGDRLRDVNGYTSLPNGMLMQWGTVYTTNSDISITFPVAFPNELFQIQVSDIDGVLAGSRFKQNSTNSGFDFHNSGGGSITAQWLAIGY